LNFIFPIVNKGDIMEIYNIIIEDRHTDVEVRSFRDREKAIETAKKIAKSLNRNIEDLEEKVIKDYEFHITYSCENDFVSVVKTVLEE